MAARIFLNYLAKGTWQADGFSGRFSLSVVFLCVLVGFLCGFSVFVWFFECREKEVYNLKKICKSQS